jgi:NTE family protein
VRGLAHLGVLTVLEREGIRIDCVAGSSVGSLIGAVYSAGYKVQQLKELASQIGWLDFASLTWPRKGFISFSKMERWLVALLGDLDFSELALPFAVVATDLESGKAVVLHEERLAAAVRASCSIPGLVPPVRMNGRFLVDGGVADNLPVSAVRDLGADYVIGVDICRPAHRRRWGPLGVGLGALENLVRRAGGGLTQADCLISPNLAGFSYVRFSQREAMIQRGIEAATDSLPAIQAALETD